MYGYFRPFKPELKVREYERYRAIYCGLCRELSKSYGFLARMLVNYDAASFIAMTGGEGESGVFFAGCPANPFKKRPCLTIGETTGFFAAASIILFWWKTVDDINDGRFFRRLAARILKLIYTPAFKKAQKARPELARLVESELGRLRQIELEGGAGDRAADCFANITAALSDVTVDEKKRRVYREMLYHCGRCIYYIDALDDMERDRISRNYNPILTFSLPPDEARIAAAQTVADSLIRVDAACGLLNDSGETAGIRDNLVRFGLPAALEGADGRGNDRRKAFGPL